MSRPNPSVERDCAKAQPLTFTLGALISMNMTHRLFQILALLYLTTMALPTLALQPIACGKEWINIHQMNPNLVGVYVQQVPDNNADAAAYRGKHPSMIIYVFKDGKAHQVEYTPSGQIENGFWWDIPKGHWIYNRLDSNVKNGVTCAYWVKK